MSSHCLPYQCQACIACLSQPDVVLCIAHSLAGQQCISCQAFGYKIATKVLGDLLQKDKAYASPGDRRSVRTRTGRAAANLEADQASSQAFLPDPRCQALSILHSVLSMS